EGMPSELTFHWFCQHVDETLDINDPASADKILIPSKAGIHEEVADTTVNGCFGSGPGQLHLETSELSFDTFEVAALQMKEGVYIMSVVISKDTRSVVFQQTVTIIGGKTADVSLMCDDTVGNGCGGKKVNPQQIYSVMTQCNEFPDVCGEIKYAWELTQRVNGNEEEQDINNFGSFTEDVGGGVVYFEAKPDSLEELSTYIIRVSASVEGFMDSKTAIEFVTTRPPSGGTCAPDRPEGEALEKFEIMCTGWEDDDDAGNIVEFKNPSFTYFYPGQVIGTANRVLILPPGKEADDYNVEIEIQVADEFGSYATVVTPVKVTPKSGAADSLMDSLTSSSASNSLVSLSSVTSVVGTLISMDEEEEVEEEVDTSKSHSVSASNKNSI
ncbi:unnamed protein product, partial [Owenia fusiformis]